MTEPQMHQASCSALAASTLAHHAIAVTATTAATHLASGRRINHDTSASTTNT
jgi:hypothetical protein